MTREDLKAIDWKKHVKGTIKSPSKSGILKPEIPRPDIADTDIPKPKESFSNILEQAAGKKQKTGQGFEQTLKETIPEHKSQTLPDTAEPISEAKPLNPEIKKVVENIPEALTKKGELGELIFNTEKTYDDVEKTLIQALKNVEETKKIGYILKQKPEINKYLDYLGKKKGINFEEWEKLPPKKLKLKLSSLTKSEQNIFNIKRFITMATKIINKLEIKK